MSIYLGIDVGTQSVKVLCHDAEARTTVAVASSPLQLIARADGTREQMPSWWIEALKDALWKIDKSIRSRIKAIGVSGQQHGLVALDSDATVVAPAKLWCDTTTSLQCQQIMADFGGVGRCINAVGNPMRTGYTAPKIRWLKDHHRELYRRVKTILLPHDYLNFFLTGQFAMECGDASGTGMLDIQRRQWHTGILQAIDADRDLGECLPPLITAHEPVGVLQPAPAVALGLAPGTLVTAGGGDNMMAAIGTGNVVSGRSTISLGTSGTLFAHADHPVIDASGALAAFCSSTGGWLPLLCTMNCTVSTELTRDLLQWPVAALDHHVKSTSIGADGIVTLPFFSGERTPDLPAAKGCIFGLDSSNYTPANLMRSAMESAVYGLRSGLDLLRQHGCDIRDIRLTGGGARSAAWRQMVADIFNLPVFVHKNDEGAALGAALQACWVAQSKSSNPVALEDLLSDQLAVDAERSTEPCSQSAQAYTAHYANYLRHVELIRPLYA